MCEAAFLANEMMDFFRIREDLVTTSAFVQRRSKIFPEAFESLFDLFTQKADEDKRYEGMRLLAADGFLRIIGTPTELAEKIDPDGSNGITPRKISKLLVQNLDTATD